ncbi:MAG: hypothetical protein ACRCU5_08160 [Rhizobiaceae bacterium]
MKRRSRWSVAKTAVIASLVTLASFAAPSVNTASAAEVFFGADLSSPNACTINVVRDGDFGISADMRTLSSKLPGGLSAIADVTSQRPYWVSAIATDYFTTGPVNSSLNTDFEARFSGTDIFRGRNFPEQLGTDAVRLRGNLSVTRLNVHLIATRTGSSFPTGTYVGNVTVRCE